MMSSVGVVYPAHALPEGLGDFVLDVEASGYDEIWIVEDCFLSGGLALATRALALSEKLRVGVGLLPATVRNPAIVAMEIATLARIYPGRLTVAFGHGVEDWMKRIGARPERRLTALGEVVTAVRMLLTGETVNVAGSFVTLESVRLENPPAVPPEILVGTTGPQGIALAGRRANGLLLPEGCGPRFIDHARKLAYGAAPGTALPSIAVYAWLVGGERDAARAQLAGAVTRWLESGLYSGPAGAALGNPTRDRGEVVSDEVADELGIIGSAEACGDATRRFLKAGTDRLILLAVGCDFSDQYARFADQVLPRVREREL